MSICEVLCYVQTAFISVTYRDSRSVSDLWNIILNSIIFILRHKSLVININEL